MYDFQVCFPAELIRLTSVSVLPNSDPLTLDILGQDFRSVDEVTINDIVSTNVIVLSKNRLLAEVPEVVKNSTAQVEVNVTSRRLTLTPKSLIRFKVGQTPSKVSGILRLVQVFLKLLFTTPGSDIFSKRLGGGALKKIGGSFSKSQSGSIVSDFVVSVDTTTRQIVALQGRDTAIPRDERLLSAKVTSAHFSAQESALIVSVELLSQTGQSALANVAI